MIRIRHVALALVAFGSVACGIPHDSAARPAAAGEVPFGLLDTSATTNSTTARPSAVATVFLLRGERLVPVRRSLGADASPATALVALADGPTPGERGGGLDSRLPADGGIGNVREGGGIVQVEVKDSFLSLDDGQRMLATGQIVLTVTAAEPTDTVVLNHDGEPVAIGLPDGSTSTEPATAAAFGSLVDP